MSCVFLSNLHLKHLVCMQKASKKRINGFTDLKIHRAVFDLQNNVVMVCSIKILKVVVARSCPVSLGVAPVLSAIIYKASPDNDASVWFDHISKHVGAISLGPSICKWTRSSLRIRFYKESSKARKPVVNLFYLIFPPIDDFFIKRIAGIKTSYFNGRSKVKGHVKLNAVTCKYV